MTEVAVGIALAVFRESVIDRQRQEIERLVMEREDLQARMIAHILESERQIRNASANAVRLQGMLDQHRDLFRQYRRGELNADEAMSEMSDVEESDVED